MPYLELWFRIQWALLTCISTSLITNNRLSWNEKPGSCFQHGQQNIVENIVEKRLIRCNFSFFFSQYFQFISNFRSQITYSYVKCGCLIYFFPNSANLISRSSNISKYFRESLELWDNESLLIWSKKLICTLVNWTDNKSLTELSCLKCHCSIPYF